MTIDCQALCQNNNDDKDTDSREEIKGIKKKGKPNQKSQLINILLLFYKYSIIFI